MQSPVTSRELGINITEKYEEGKEAAVARENEMQGVRPDSTKAEFFF